MPLNLNPAVRGGTNCPLFAAHGRIARNTLKGTPWCHMKDPAKPGSGRAGNTTTAPMVPTGYPDME
ncbi:MAG: hypothetical protein ACREUR_07585 [Nitrosospira sp.]